MKVKRYNKEEIIKRVKKVVERVYRENYNLEISL